MAQTKRDCKVIPFPNATPVAVTWLARVRAWLNRKLNHVSQ